MDCEANDNISVTNDKNNEEYVSQYLESHRSFADQWFRSHLGSKSSDHCYPSDSVDALSGDGRSQPSPTCESVLHQQTSEQCLVDTTMSNLLRDNKYKHAEDEESLTASYAVMAREGRNSVTCDLFRDMVENGRKKSNSSNIAGAPVLLVVCCMLA